MARLFTCGYETGLLDEDGGVTTSNNGSAVIATANPAPRTGTYCMKLSVVAGSTSYYARRTISLPATSRVYLRVGIFIHLGPAEGALTIWRDYDSAGALQFELRYDPTTQLLTAYRGTTQVAQSTAGVSPEAWHALFVDHLVADANGIFRVYLDSTASPILSFSGDTNNTTNANVKSFACGIIARSTPGDSNTYIGIDDLAANDTTGAYENGLPGLGGVLLLRPNGPGSYAQLTPSAGGSNWDCVDEVPPDVGDYVYSSTTDQRDTYTLTDLPAPFGQVALVQPIAYAALAVAGTGALRCTIRSGATNADDAADTPISTTYAFVKGDVRYVDPADGGAWTPARVNALQSGVIVR